MLPAIVRLILACSSDATHPTYTVYSYIPVLKMYSYFQNPTKMNFLIIL